MEEQLPEGLSSLRISWERVDDIPILFVNQVLGQVGQQSEVILTFGQIAPPAILGQDQADREMQLRGVTHIPVKPIARLALTRTGLEQLVDVLNQTLENHDKAQELMAQAQRMMDEGEG